MQGVIPLLAANDDWKVPTQVRMGGWHDGLHWRPVLVAYFGGLFWRHAYLWNDRDIPEKRLPVLAQPALKPLQRVKAITGIAQERNTLHAFTVALGGEVGWTVDDVLVLDVAGSPASLSYSTLM